MGRIGSGPIKRVVNSTTLSANNTTASVDMFQIKGAILLHGLYGVVTTALGANVTAAHLRLDDGTAQVDMTLASGVALSAAPVDSVIIKEGLLTAALTYLSSAAGAYDEPGTANAGQFSGGTLVEKNSADTHIEFRYSTTDTPTSGVIKWYAMWEQVSDDGQLLVA